MLAKLFIASLLLCVSTKTIEAAVVTHPPDYDLAVSFDLPGSKLQGEATLTVESGKTIQLRVGNLVVHQATLNGNRIDFETKDGKILVRPSDAGVLRISYEGTFKASGSRSDSGTPQNTIDNRGIFLADTWYPGTEDRLHYRLKAVLPNGYEAVSGTEKVEKFEKGNKTEFTFSFDHAVDKISLIAGPFRILAGRVDGVDLFIYFFPKDQGRAIKHLNETSKFFESYDKLLSKYPYSRFSIVESFLPGNFSLPLCEVVGSRFPSEMFPADQLLTQWFGKLVSVDREKGDWSKGLTTYLAELRDEKKTDGKWEARKELLLDYHAWVNPSNEISLREFKGGTDPASLAVGRGKGALVFHMLEQSIGEEGFFAALRDFIADHRYKAATWDDIRQALEKHTKKDLTSFFGQWVDRKGLPKLVAGNGKVVRRGDNFEISFDLLQKDQLYSLDIPARVFLAPGGIKPERLFADAEKNNFKIKAGEEPRRIVIDPDYDIPRSLAEDEIPPQFAAILGDPKLLIAAPVSNEDAYKSIREFFKAKGVEEKMAADIRQEEIKYSSLVVLGDDNPLVGMLFGSVKKTEAGFSVSVRKNPWNSGKAIAIFNSRSAAEAAASFPRIYDCSRYSAAVFTEGKNILTKTDESQRGLEMELRGPATAIDTSSLKTIDDAIKGSEGKKIVYVGEQHDKYAHHLVQLQVLKALYEQDHRIAVGMEMFQRPFQKVLDDYVARTIDERQFLKKSEYFKRWIFDYNLYKPILDFAREQKIPVIALNQKTELVDKVSRSGLDSLSPDEKKDTPGQMDFSDSDYRERLKNVFSRHEKTGKKNFDYFYQAQVLWDETMAMSIDEFFKKNPDYRMIVAAGRGHIDYGSGIPKRVYRRNSLPYYLLVNDADIDRNIADYILFPDPLEGMPAPKLMAALKVENNRVMVTDLPEQSISKAAGIRAGDAIVSLDGTEIKSVEDIRLILFYKQTGDIVRVKVLRRRLLLGDKEVEFQVKL